MARISTRQLRRESGLCQTCGIPRGDNGTQLYCASCAETVRLNSREWRRRNTNRPLPLQTKENRRRLKAGYYADCVASGRCTVCNQTLLTFQEKQNGFVNCAACRIKNREKYARSRQKKRDRGRRHPEGHSYHWPHGERPATLPGGRGEAFRCGLNDRAYTALLNLWENYRKEEMAAGRQPHMRRASHLVREAIHQWKNRLIGPTPYPHTLIARTITVYLNPDTVRILEWQARNCFQGNKSAALRMILIAVGSPHPTPVAIPRHRGKWDD